MCKPISSSDRHVYIVVIITQACLDPQDPPEKEASMGCQVPEGPWDLLDGQVKVEHEVCPVRWMIYIFIWKEE